MKVTNPVKAVYGIVNFAEGIRNLIMTALRSIVGEMDLDQALSSRDKIKARLRESIAEEVLDWGLTVKSVEIQDIKPSPSMQKAMELQAAAERERKATVTKAEGDKQSMILQAEARLESAKRDAEAQVTLAESSATSIQKVMAAATDRTRLWPICSAKNTSRRSRKSPVRPMPRSSFCPRIFRKPCAACSESSVKPVKTARIRKISLQINQTVLWLTSCSFFIVKENVMLGLFRSAAGLFAGATAIAGAEQLFGSTKKVAKGPQPTPGS